MATSEQLTNAGIILNVGSGLGANSKQLLAAIEAALVESNLVNVRHGDRDSLGLFQQRPSQGWGTPSQVMDPYYAANAFFVGAGTNRGALQVSQSGSAGQLAQRVQRSAFPGRYDQREGEAASYLASLGVGQTQTPNGWWNDITSSAGGYATGDDDWHLPEYQDNGSSDSSTSVIIIAVVAVVGILVLDSLVNG